MFYSLLVDADSETKNLDISEFSLKTFEQGHEKISNVDWFPIRSDINQAVQAQKMATAGNLDFESRRIILSV